MKAIRYWGVQRVFDDGSVDMPCLFGSRRAAIENRDWNERVVRVSVEILWAGRAAPSVATANRARRYAARKKRAR